MTGENFELTICRTIRAPRSAVWAAWSEREHFEKWWIPEPIKCKTIKMDLKPGGGFETQMSEDGGLTFMPHLEGCFLEIVPKERIVFTTALTESWRPFDPWLALTAIITMEDKGKDTKYMARVLHKNQEESCKHQEMGFEEGWGTTIEQLGKMAATLVDSYPAV
ncbi:polyketide cyclase [Leptolyngbya sp. NK1-12]|uniref:Polyketide cyclase n=1 Tax=Leptolyngbya sp. NK1-12 TaxID=2547451 RepID=A0AA96WHT3_9CYAN|nr:polyketide cyclase [Leptolyngbya sp. NK1-12]